MRLRRLLFGMGFAALAVAVAGAPSRARAAAAQTWPPFALVSGLLLVGAVAHRDGLFDAVGAAAGRWQARPVLLLVVLLGTVAVVTAVLNLDTAVAFLTPVLVATARARGLDEEPFLYGALLMSNAASLLLPGSNLTNLLVLAKEHVSGAVFAARMAPAWVAAVAVTAVFVVVVYRGVLTDDPPPPQAAPVATLHIGWGMVGIAGAVVAMLFLRTAALPVLVSGALVAVLAAIRGKLSRDEVVEAIDPGVLAGVFALAVALGTLARVWSGPARLMGSASRASTAAIGAAAAVVLNNLPAAVLLGSQHPAHPRALLLGLNLGPNLAVTGSLSALLWFRAARTVGAKPSIWRVSRLGVVLVPVSVVAAASALHLFSPGSL